MVSLVHINHVGIVRFLLTKVECYEILGIVVFKLVRCQRLFGLMVYADEIMRKAV